MVAIPEAEFVRAWAASLEEEHAGESTYPSGKGRLLTGNYVRNWIRNVSPIYREDFYVWIDNLIKWGFMQRSGGKRKRYMTDEEYYLNSQFRLTADGLVWFDRCKAALKGPIIMRDMLNA